MKREIEKSYKATIYACDHCGKEIEFSADECIVCGKSACGECYHKTTVILEERQQPRFCYSSYGLPGVRFVACVTCENEVTKRFAEMKSKLEKALKQCQEWDQWYRKELGAIRRMVDKIEKQRGND